MNIGIFKVFILIFHITLYWLCLINSLSAYLLYPTCSYSLFTEDTHSLAEYLCVSLLSTVALFVKSANEAVIKEYKEKENTLIGFPYLFAL